MKNIEEKLDRIQVMVKERLSCSAHNFDHVLRVYRTCLLLAEDEAQINLDVLKAAALLHDIARVEEDTDNTGTIDHSIVGAEKAGEILADEGFEPGFIDQVKHCIVTHRYRSGNLPQSIEAKVLFDADKLDVLGAVGIARAYMIAGQYGEPMYRDVNIDEYVRENLVGGGVSGRIRDITQHSVNIEYETKFRKIPERLFTEKAREVAMERLAYMEGFFKRLGQEISGKK